MFLVYAVGSVYHVISVYCYKLLYSRAINMPSNLDIGTYIGWIYLRYFQKKQETKIKGDPSDEFSFSAFFPEFLR